MKWGRPVVTRGARFWHVQPEEGPTRGEEIFHLDGALTQERAQERAELMFRRLDAGSLSWYDATQGNF